VIQTTTTSTDTQTLKPLDQGPRFRCATAASTLMRSGGNAQWLARAQAVLVKSETCLGSTLFPEHLGRGGDVSPHFIVLTSPSPGTICLLDYDPDCT